MENAHVLFHLLPVPAYGNTPRSSTASPAVPASSRPAGGNAPGRDQSKGKGRAPVPAMLGLISGLRMDRISVWCSKHQRAALMLNQGSVVLKATICVPNPAARASIQLTLAPSRRAAAAHRLGAATAATAAATDC
eukprot:643943-Amphidinium_carterae.1